MQLKQIGTFYWAARLGSFARAARHAHMTTSTVAEVVALGWLPTLISELRIRFPDIQADIEVTLWSLRWPCRSWSEEERSPSHDHWSIRSNAQPGFVT